MSQVGKNLLSALKVRYTSEIQCATNQDKLDALESLKF